MTKDNVKKILPIILLVGYAFFGISYLFNLIAGDSKFTGSLFSIPVFAVLYFLLKILYRNIMQIEENGLKKRRILFVLAVGFLLGLSYVMGYQLRINEMTSLGIKGKLFILLVSGGLSIAFSPAVNLFFVLLDRFEGGKWQKNGDEGWIRKTFWTSFCIIFICWIPVFLAYYPAIMSYDFHRQCSEAALGFYAFNDYQPLAHTFLIWVAMQLGKAIGSYEIGMAVFSLFQMIVLDLSMAFCCSMVAKLTKRKWPVVVAVSIYGLLPVHGVLSMSMTKDILFTAFITIFSILMMERRFLKQQGSTGAWQGILLDFGMVITGILSIFFRNNAVYAIAVFVVFYLIWTNKERVRILILCLVILIAGTQLKEGIRLAMHAGKGSKVEMYSVVVAQVARAAHFHKELLDPEMLYMCEYIAPEDAWDKVYLPLADGVKNTVAISTFQVWKDEIPKMFSYWLKIGLRYPNDYLDAFLGLTSGYWFLDDVSHAEMLGYGDDTNMGLLYTFNASVNDKFDGVESKSFLPGLLKWYSHIVNGNGYYNWPVLSNLFKPAFYCWILFLTIVGLIYVKQYKKLVVCALPFWYLMTLLLGPTALVRYIYPIMVMAPVLLAWLFSGADWNVDECKTKENLQ